jgi:DNA polymerase-3 subunit epsilon
MPFAFRNPALERPFCVLDLETTGVAPQADRIVEIALARFDPGAAGPLRYRPLVHPGRPIPPAAAAFHGLADADVADQRRFAALAGRLLCRLDGRDLAGFNLRRFDLPFLAAELARAGYELLLAGRSVIDVMQLFHRQHPRDLAAAVRHHLGREHVAAHSAPEDALATAAVLDAQVGFGAGLPATVAALHARLVEVDVAGKFRREAGRVALGFGKHAGEPLRSVARRDPSYLRWLLRQGLLDDARARIERALRKAGDDGRGSPRPSAPDGRRRVASRRVLAAGHPRPAAWALVPADRPRHSGSSRARTTGREGSRDIRT